MTSHRQKDHPPPLPRLYLVTPVAGDIGGLGETLGAMLATTDIAAVLLRLAPADERTQINRVKTLAPLVQENGAALLLDGLPGIVARSGADGAHLTGIEAFLGAMPNLKPDRIAGAGGLETRHDAMSAAEKGADYVMFGEPDADGTRPAFAAVCERVSWWADVFESPCVGYAGSMAEIAALAACGADFVAAGEFLFADPRGPAAAIEEAARVLAGEAAS